MDRTGNDYGAPDQDAGVDLSRTLIGRPTVSISWGGRTRLHVADDGPLSRFQRSLHAPAFRRSAIAYKTFLAVRATVAPTRHSALVQDGVQSWLPPALSHLQVIAAIIGTPTRAQSIVAYLANHRGRTEAIAKVAVAASGNAAIHREVEALSDPAIAGKAPRLLCACPFGELAAFIATHEAGRPGKTNHSGPKEAVLALPTAAGTSQRHSMVEHPWVTRVCTASDLDIEAFERLAPRPLPTVRTHGDFAPWNLLVKRDGSVIAIDWESSEPDGIPGTDLAHYVMATLGFIRRQAPSATVDRTIDTLRRHAGLDHGTALACTTLAAARTRLREREGTGFAGYGFWDVALEAALQRVAERA